MTRIRRECVFLVYTMTLWKHVVTQCSEAHSVACSLPLMHLKNYEGLLDPLGGFLPDYNETTLTDLCSYFQTYMTCSQSFLNNCDNETVIQLQEMNSAFTPICTYSKEYINHRACYKQRQKLYDNCHKKRQRSFPTTSVQLCQITNDYVNCIYTVTAFGCSLDAAELYFKIINQSVYMFTNYIHPACPIHHPSIKILTTTTTTTTKRTTTIRQTQGITTPNIRIPNTSGNSQHTSSAKTYRPHCTYSFITFVLIYWLNMFSDAL